MQEKYILELSVCLAVAAQIEWENTWEDFCTSQITLWTVKACFTQKKKKKGKMKEMGYMRLEGNETSKRENKELIIETWGPAVLQAGEEEPAKRQERHGW